MRKPLKLSKPQQRIVDQMREGWSLCCAQNNRVFFLYEARSATSEKVHAATFNFLEVNGIIRYANGVYVLTEEWR